MRNVEIEAIRVVRQINKIVISVPDDFNMSVCSARDLASEAFQLGLLADNDWKTINSEIIGANLVGETYQEARIILEEF